MLTVVLSQTAHMRTALTAGPLIAVALLLGAALATPATAFAQAGAPSPGDAAAAGTYEVTYAEVSNNCTDGAVSLKSGSLTVVVTGGKLAVEIGGIPRMVGNAAKGGKIKAQSEADPSKSDRPGGKFSVGGKIDGTGSIKLVLDAEHYAGKKPTCTQSWSVTGRKKA
jgi:hypothetical protein